MLGIEPGVPGLGRKNAPPSPTGIFCIKEESSHYIFITLSMSLQKQGRDELAGREVDLQLHGQQIRQKDGANLSGLSGTTS